MGPSCVTVIPVTHSYAGHSCMVCVLDIMDVAQGDSSTCNWIPGSYPLRTSELTHRCAPPACGCPPVVLLSLRLHTRAPRACSDSLKDPWLCDPRPQGNPPPARASCPASVLQPRSANFCPEVLDSNYFQCYRPHCFRISVVLGYNQL